MKITVYIYTTKKPEDFYKAAIEEYGKRLTRYVKIEYKIIRKEKEWIGCIEREKDAVIYAVKEGETISSEDFSELLGNYEKQSVKKLVFLIADHMPVSGHTALTECFQTFSLSSYSLLPLEQAMVLYEQIYRGYRIMNNHPYHK